MMLLLFKVRDDRYGIDVKSIIEVMPSVPVQRIPKVPDYFAGLLNYRGGVVPVLDLSQLIDHCTSKPCLSTRIILVESPGEQHPPLGLLAEGATETIKVAADDFSHTSIGVEGEAFVDGMIMNETGMIRLVNLDNLLTPEVREFLFNAPALATTEGAEHGV